MNPIKCDEDIPSVLHLPIPFVVMRQNVDVKMHLHKRKQYFALIRCVLAGLFLIGLADLLMTQKVFFFILLSFLVVCCSSVLSSYEASIKQKQHLAMTQRLPNIVPFLHIDGQRLCLYDCYGYQAIEVSLASFRAMHLKKVRCGNCWLEISYFNQSSKKTSYLLETKGVVYYFEHQSNSYQINDFSWFINNIADMLRQNPTAEYFPFQKKNYTKKQLWNSP